MAPPSDLHSASASTTRWVSVPRRASRHRSTPPAPRPRRRPRSVAYDVRCDRPPHQSAGAVASIRPVPALRAVLFDLGGVVFDSPLDGFTRYETEIGLPANFIRTLNATNSDTNAWA